MTSEQRAIQLTEILETVSDPATLNTTNTPQNRVLNYIIEGDSLNVCPSYENAMHRYVMAVLFYSWGKSSSISSGAECGWGGITCANVNITKLSFGE